MAVERIEWIDSVGQPGWVKLTAIHDTHRDMPITPIISVGHVIYEDDAAITLCLSRGGVTDEYAECMTIPKAVIQARLVVRRDR